MRLNTTSPTMASTAEQLVIDTQSRFLEMKSLQPYSTTDEYLYAMKEDLADWLSNMYPEWRPLTADTFLECLENGALLCQHANNVNDAARQSSAPGLPYFTLANCKYRFDARPKTFNARDNVSQFIKWARRVAGVREVLMFESDDLILRKNEKNFLLCLLEIARYGARFGISVPAIIQLEDEIEQEIQREKQIELVPLADLKRVARGTGDDEQNHKNKVSTSTTTTDDQQRDTHPSTSTESHSRLPLLHSSTDEEPQRAFLSTSLIVAKEPEHVDGTRIVREDEKENSPQVPASSSQLHKTVVQIANSCCCAHRFPVIRIGEGKYRIGESGTIIFIRILRYHVMVRVGGGWDTLENYLNKHDPCRRSNAHRRTEQQQHHHQHADIPILAVPKAQASSNVPKTNPFGKSVTVKTEEFPLTKPSNHDTNLVDAQLVITRDADGRHRIGQITYKSEEDILHQQQQQASCPHHHHHHRSPSASKIKSTRSSSTATFHQQSSPSTDQDYSSLTDTPSKPSSFDHKRERSRKPAPNSFTEHIRTRRRTSPAVSLPLSDDTPSLSLKNRRGITESIIDTIDDYIRPSSAGSERDFDLHDIQDALAIRRTSTSNEDDSTNMDNDSLESSEGILDDASKITASPLPPAAPPSKSTVNRKKPPPSSIGNAKSRYSTRSNTVPNVMEAVRKESEQSRRSPSTSMPKVTRKIPPLTRRSQSSELIDKIADTSKLDRDSGFDEQDFRRERLHSNGDDVSSISSFKSARSSVAAAARSTNFEYRENKSYELRLKKLDAKRQSVEQESALKSRRVRNSSSSAKRSNETVPTTYRDRKFSQPTIKF